MPVRLSFVIVAALTALQAAPTLAQEWPRKPITWILPVPPGGATDMTGRILQDGLAKELGQPIVIDNRPGGATRVAIETTKRSAPDGYTFGLVGAAFSSNPTLLKAVDYDPQKDFEHVAFFWKAPAVVVVHPSQPYRTLDELLNAGRQNPGAISFGTPGVGTSMHIAGELLKLSAAVQLTHLAYRGAGPALTDILAGHIPMAITNIASAAPHVKQGKLRALAVTSKERAPLLPDVPSISEAGFPDFDVAEWHALVAPLNTPRPVVERMNRAIRQVLATPDIAARWQEMGFQYRAMDPDELKQYVAAETNKFSDIIRRAGIKAAD